MSEARWGGGVQGGSHRTATAGDVRTSAWLAASLRAAGLVEVTVDEGGAAIPPHSTLLCQIGTSMGNEKFTRRVDPKFAS